MEAGLNACTSAIGGVFQHYRCTKLRYRIMPQTGITDVESVGFYPDPTGANSASEVTNMLGLDNILITKSHTTPTPWHDVPPSRLQGLQPWYKCVADAADVETEVQGRVILSGTNAEAVWWELEGIMEFKNPISGSNQ